MDNFLSLGLSSPNQLVRAMSLKGLTSILMDPKKVRGGASRSCARKASRRRHARRASRRVQLGGVHGEGKPGQGRRGWACVGNPAVVHRAGGAWEGWTLAS